MSLFGLVMVESTTKPDGVALRATKHCEPPIVAFPGFCGAWSPPPVQSVVAPALSIPHVRGSCEPQALAASAHRSHAEKLLMPSDFGLAFGTYLFSRPMYFCIAGYL